MRNRLIIDGNAVYEIDEECMRKKQNKNSGRGGSSANSQLRPGQKESKG